MSSSSTPAALIERSAVISPSLAGVDAHADPARSPRRSARRRRPAARAARRRRRVPAVADVDLDDVAADPALELGRGAGRDRPAVIDDHDLAGELVGLVEVLRGQQHVGARARPAPGSPPTARSGCAGQGPSSARRAAAAAERRPGSPRGPAAGASRLSTCAPAGRPPRPARVARARAAALAFAVRRLCPNRPATISRFSRPVIAGSTAAN